MELNKLNKKGIVFTIMIIALLTFFTVTYSAYSIIQDRTPINKRIESLNSFAKSAEEDLSRHLFISGYRIIFLMQQYTLDEHSYITDFQNSIEDLFFNATLYNKEKYLMDDGKFSDILASLNNNAQKVNAKVEMLNPEISLIQYDSWNMKFFMNITLIIEDKSNLVKWNRTSQFEATIPINTFLDPIYHVETSGKVENKIVKTPYSIFVTGADYSNLTSHYQNSYYKASTSAPDFSGRLTGNFSASPLGLESIVYPQNLIERGISVKYKSLIDYIYFSNNNPQAYSVPEIPNFIIDDEDNHLEIYSVSGTTIPI